MIDAKAAVRKAIEYLEQFSEFIPSFGIRLEEVEHEDFGDWLITLSTVEPPPASLLSNNLSHLMSGKRIYKMFRIDSDTGDVKSMKVRTLQPIE
jgi:hypothetical protein